MDFHVGDKVIHSAHGMADIVKKEKKEISGVRTQYYVVRTKDLTIWIPVENTGNGSLRMPSSRSAFKRLFPILRARYQPFSKNRLERKSQIQSRIKEGNSEALCHLVDPTPHPRGLHRLREVNRFPFPLELEVVLHLRNHG